MLMVLFDIEDVGHHEFLHQGQTVNHWCYLKVLKRLREKSGENGSVMEKQLLVLPL
jgi:hypothetical protein